MPSAPSRRCPRVRFEVELFRFLASARSRITNERNATARRLKATVNPKVVVMPSIERWITCKRLGVGGGEGGCDDERGGDEIGGWGGGWG